LLAPRLDSFLELKIENERLRQQLLDLRTSAVPPSPVLASPAYPIGQIAPQSETSLAQATSVASSPVYPNANLARTGDADAAYQPPGIHAMPQPPSTTNHFYPTPNQFPRNPYDPLYSSGTAAGSSIAGPSARRGSIVEETLAESAEAGRSRKKGPLGAKTLCNACGLRWAKRNTKRKTDEFGGAEGGGG
ncbi:hypothetical protein FRC09_009880, partial [Ceratobasidium sp. 395]